MIRLTDKEIFDIKRSVWHETDLIPKAAHELIVSVQDALAEKNEGEGVLSRHAAGLAELEAEVERLRETDPLQGAANWLVEAHSGLTVAELAHNLSIGYSDASRLIEAALAAHKGQS